MKETLEISEQELQEIRARQIACFLAPFFKFHLYNEHPLLKLTPFPRIRILPTPSEVPIYQGKLKPLDKNPIIDLPSSASESVLAHELGHWFHNMMNCDEYSYISGLIWGPSNFRLIFREGIANYAEVIYNASKNPLPNPRFRLDELVRMRFSSARLIEGDLTKFFIGEIDSRIA